jgi:hypothetical protein
MGSFEWNIQTGEIRWSANLETIHGLPRGTFSGTFVGSGGTSTGEPIGLVLNTQMLERSPTREAMPVIGPHSDSLISTAGDRLRIWNLDPDVRPADDIVAWSQVMASYGVDAVGGYIPLDLRDTPGSHLAF